MSHSHEETPSHNDLHQAATLAYAWLYAVALPHMHAKDDTCWHMTHVERNQLQAALMALGMALGENKL